MRLFFLFVIIFLSEVYTHEICKDTYTFVSLVYSKPIFDYRVNAFSKFFGDSLFDSTKDGLYIFHELNGVQRLFIVDSSVDFVRIYQLPRTKLLPWLHPEKYIKKRDQLLNSGIPKANCYVQKKMTSTFFTTFDSLKLSSHLYAWPSSQPCDELEQMEYKMNFMYSILGFQQNKGNRSYFYYENYERFGRHNLKSIEVYSKIFDLLTPFNNSILLSECE